jgi:hypothetical protein
MRICVIGLLLRDSEGERRSVQKMLHGFTYALLMVTYKRLETIAEEQGDYPPIVPRITYQWRCRYRQVTSQ